MNVTELLVTGFDGEKAVFAASLTPDRVATIVTSTDTAGKTTVEAAGEQTTPAFDSIRRLVEELAILSCAPREVPLPKANLPHATGIWVQHEGTTLST
jgi:hypothetical protein